MNAKCLRCGDRFERRSPDQIHCIPCSTEVAALIRLDERRRTPRQVAGWRFIDKDMSNGRRAA